MADNLRRPPPPPPPSRPTATSNGDTKSSKEMQRKVEERMKENTDLRQLLNSLRLDQKERSNNPGINRPPPPPKGNGRGRGLIEKSEQMVTCTYFLFLISFKILEILDVSFSIFVA